MTTVNLPLNLFRATVADTDTERLRSPHTLFDMYLDYMLKKFEANRMVGNVQMWSFEKKGVF